MVLLDKSFSPHLTTGRCRLLATTDLHAQILSYDYYADRAVAQPALASLATRLRELRSDGVASVLLDNGDFIQGNPMADWAASDGRDAPHPVIAAMNVVGYDAAALGNHEFNFGLPLIDKIAAEAEFPLLSANLHVAGWAVRPWIILTRDVTDSAGQVHPLRIGVLGLAPAHIRQWDRVILDGALVAEDMVAAAPAHITAMRAAGADLVIVLGHTGLGCGTGPLERENQGADLAALPGIDALVLGHVHETFPDPEAEDLLADPRIDHVNGLLNGTTTLMPGSHGSHLGVVDFALTHDGTRWHVAGRKAALVAIAPDTPADPAVTAVMAAPHEKVLDRIRRPVGYASRPLHSHFALIRADDSLQVVADAQAYAARTALRGTDYSDLPLLSAVAPFRAGARAGPYGYIDLPAGPLSLCNAAELYLYPNNLCVVETTGAVVADWLERSAGLFHTLRPGARGQPLIDQGFPSYNFDVLFGLTYEIDLHGPVLAEGGQRIRDLRWRGKPITPAMRFAVATNTYRAGGAGGFDAVVEGGRIIHHDSRKVRDVVIDHLHQLGPRAAEPVWRFAPMADTGAWFQTHPNAVPPADMAMTDLGIDRHGFRRFELDLS